MKTQRVSKDYLFKTQKKKLVIAFVVSVKYVFASIENQLCLLKRVADLLGCI